VALLQDICAALPRWGCDMTCFASVDYDEIFVCISLESDVAIESYLLKSSTMLQMKKDVVSKLGIDQPPEEATSSPPYLRYDPRVVRNLYKSGLLEKDCPRQLFKTHHGRDAKGNIVCGSERFRMIFKQLGTQIDLDVAKKLGLIIDWYPAHSTAWLARLYKPWGDLKLLLDLSFVQPIPMIREYLGPRVAFIFAWNGFYCKALLALTFVALPIEAAVNVLTMCGLLGPTIHKRTVLAFSVVITIWARLTVNAWNREQEYFVNLWELEPGDGSQSTRPSFQGFMRASKADSNITEKAYPTGMATLRRVASTSITLVFCCVVCTCIVIWTNIFEGDLNLTASICLSVMVAVFGLVFNAFVPILTEWENHKVQSTFYDSYVFKKFIFEAVNRYSAMACPSGGCMAALHKQLWMTLLILSCIRIFEIILAGVMVRVKLWLEDRTMKKEAEEVEHQEAPKRSFAELQSKFAESRMQEQIESTMQLVLALGFVLLFSAIAPIIVPFSLVVFVVQLRGSAYLLVNLSKRPLPRHQYGIGIWGGIVAFLVELSIFFSGFLIVTYGDEFRGKQLITKLTGLILYIVAMNCIMRGVDLVYPPTMEETQVLKARRDRVRKVVLERAAHVAHAPKARDQSTDDHKEALIALSNVIARGDWDAIRHLDDLCASRCGKPLRGAELPEADLAVQEDPPKRRQEQKRGRSAVV